MVKELPLSQGFVALVDDADYELVRHLKWSLLKPNRRGRPAYYASRRFYNAELGANCNEYLHRFLMGLSNHDQRRVDHKDGDGLNCQRENLRFATPSQNAANMIRQTPNVSGFRGVSPRCTKTGKMRWVAFISDHGRSIYLGTFKSPEEAARIYDDNARTRYGEFARLNFPREGEQHA